MPVSDATLSATPSMSPMIAGDTASTFARNSGIT